MDVRPYEPRDRAACVSLLREVFGEPEPHNEYGALLDRLAEIEASVVLVATAQGRVVGTTIGGYDGVRGWLYSVAVAPTHRRHGVGRSLVQRAEAILSSRGCPKINLQMRGDNREVEAFYDKLGYATEDRVSMGKRLLS